MALIQDTTRPLSPIVLQIVMEHHERSDGSGFPGGIIEEKMHPASLVLAVADAFDRSMRGAWSGDTLSPAEAFERLRKEFMAGHFSQSIFEKIGLLSA